VKTSKSTLASPDAASSEGRTAESSPALIASSPTNSSSGYSESSEETECCGEWRKCGALRRLMKCCCYPDQTAADLIMAGLPAKCADSRSYECCCGAVDMPSAQMVERKEAAQATGAVVVEAEAVVEAY